MTRRTIQFELMVGVLVVAAGAWLTGNQVADWGLLVVGCLLIAAAVTSRGNELRQWLHRVKAQRPLGRDLLGKER